MLAITRRPKQQIKIGENILIEVIKISGQNTVLGFKAPKEIEIKRVKTQEQENTLTHTPKTD